MFLISKHAAARAILGRVFGPCSEAAEVAVNPMFSLSARASNEVASFDSHGQGHIAPIIRARHLCIGTHTEGMLARQSASEHLSQSVLHKGLSIRFLHRKECVKKPEFLAIHVAEQKKLLQHIYFPFQS